MAIYRPFVFPPSMITRPMKYPRCLLALAAVFSAILLPLFLYVVMVDIEVWKELSSMAFIKAVVAPAALYVLYYFLMEFVLLSLFYFSESSTVRLYERFGLAHVICAPGINTFRDFLKACLVTLQYAVGSIAVVLPLMQHQEGFSEMFRQIWPVCTQPLDECMIAKSYGTLASILAGVSVIILGAMSIGAMIRHAEFLVLFMLTKYCAHKHEGKNQAMEKKKVITV